MPAFSASTQIGEAAVHQKGSSLAIVKISPGRAGSSIRLATMPCRSGTSPVTSVQWLGKVRSEEHTSELQSLMRISYAVFCLKKKKNAHTNKVALLTTATTTQQLRSYYN